MRLRLPKNREDGFGVSSRILFRMVLLAIHSAPSELRNLLLANVVIGAGPVVLLYLGKRVIDETSRLAVVAGTTDSIGEIVDAPVLMWNIIGFVAVNILLDSVDTLRIFASMALRERLIGTVKSRIFRKIAQFDDIAIFENPDQLDTLQLAQQSVPRFRQLASVLSEVTTGLFVFLPVLALSLSIAWWIPLLIFCSSAPSIWTQMRYGEKSWNLERTQAGATRRMEVYEQILTGPEYAKELRQFDLQSHFLQRWNGLFWPAFDERRRVRRHGSLIVVSWSTLTGLGTGLPYLYVILEALNGKYTPGDLALYAGLVFQVRRSLYALLGSTTNLQEIALSVTALFQLLDLQSTLGSASMVTVPTGAGNSHAHTSREGITIAGVSFAYPGSDKLAVRDVNLRIRPGELVVVVGENGGGKTTLAKLLCRLYDPQNGAILWDGTDIRAMDLAVLRREIAVVNQDFARFPATLRENIEFGAVEQMGNNDSVLRAADGAMLELMIERLPRGLDTPLSKQLEHGIEPSGGQWQRIALARALMREPQSKLVLLDEPTAALDPKTEHEMLGLFRNMARDKIAIVISHRLALARLAHQVVVMEHGRIIELGTHEQLMERKGVYQTLFMQQASSYLPDDQSKT